PLFDYMDRIKDFARREGYVETIFGRRRPMPDIHSSNFVVRQAAERAAINMPIQGTEADLMKLAMIHVEAKLDELSPRHSRPDRESSNTKSASGSTQLNWIPSQAEDDGNRPKM